MKAAVHNSFGEPIDVIEATDVDTPTAGAGEVLVKMTLSPIQRARKDPETKRPGGVNGGKKLKAPLVERAYPKKPGRGTSKTPTRSQNHYVKKGKRNDT